MKILKETITVTNSETQNIVLVTTQAGVDFFNKVVAKEMQKEIEMSKPKVKPRGKNYTKPKKRK